MQLPKKSRSRLDRSASYKLSTNLNFFDLISSSTKILATLLANISEGFKVSANFNAYRQRLPQLGIALGLGFALLQLMQHVSPQTVAHVLFPNSYLPITSLWFLCWWYLSGFILQNSKRGLFMSCLATLWLYTRLQLVITAWWWWSIVLLGWLLLEIVAAKIRTRRI